LSIPQKIYADGSDIIKVGCGGRGSGAARAKFNTSSIPGLISVVSLETS